ncbi:Hypothetical protein BJL86_0327 [Dietzia timorensis]|uniref:Butirosin biosynthesis protein H N-terminal domain-containing protein n=1 Tax=Dietzia timorensis TaxID=499555 RepID=A0A173LIM9_9ACTN|nr:Hypothetical protein BJL86_0327 [Dietzia timorensis]
MVIVWRTPGAASPSAFLELSLGGRRRNEGSFRWTAEVGTCLHERMYSHVTACPSNRKPRRLLRRRFRRCHVSRGPYPSSRAATSPTGLSHRQAGHCGSGALRDLLEWAGLGWDEVPSEGLVFGMGGGLGFTYLRAPGLAPPIYFVGRSSDLEVDLLARLGAEVDVREPDDPETGWGWVRRELQQGRPVLMWADISELPYLNVRLQMSRHDIVVIGYEDDTETAFVVDNDRAEMQKVPYEALARARASRSFPVPTRHTTYFVNWPQILPDLRQTAASASWPRSKTCRRRQPRLFRTRRCYRRMPLPLPGSVESRSRRGCRPVAGAHARTGTGHRAAFSPRLCREGRHGRRPVPPVAGSSVATWPG